MKTLRIIQFTILITIFFSCSKEDKTQAKSSTVITSNNNSGGGGSSSSSCSSISPQNTITHNGVTYKIEAVSGSNYVIGIEVINITGAFTSSYSIDYLQVSNGSDCTQTSSGSEVNGGLYKYFEFNNMPSWAILNSSIAKVSLKLDGTTYFLQDLHMNQ